MNALDRRQRILEWLRLKRRVTVAWLAEQTGASLETIRRDLAGLASEGLVEKFHGGAAIPDNPAYENAFATRMYEQVDAKTAVAETAAALFAAGDSLFVDTGTTTLLFARALAGQRGLTVITNCVRIAQALGESENRVFLIGGEYEPDAQEAVGTFAQDQIARFNAAHVVITAGALDAGGVMDFSLAEADVARAMIAQADTVTVLADASKLGRRALFKVIPLARIDRLVVDAEPDAELRDVLDEAGVALYIAGTV
ncbi:DeoR/GlpR family DNA-binding transcription regulator [Salinisphaera sp. LB1]|uniref:DeoR/GlpR family DNA-binding transcription regulator n=1 Tax=Salinisphaera sp. LB1 TaxID=2183911 RepID=UPI000D7061F2|nr:DeoR/GlpR family DNA-binding transcription regulator [Salinisphaera sp. LB1]AWN15444.1 Transcriptional regulator, DeoR family [Salinisphaera sp. LB1]